MGHIIGCINQKGGVAKTTTAHTLAREFAKKHKVLLIDFDGQATLTRLINLEHYFPEDALQEYFNENDLTKIFERKVIEPLDITEILIQNENCTSAPVKELHFLASPGQSLGSVADAVTAGKDAMLKRYLNKIKDDYDFIIIDSLPSVSTLFKNILWASDSILMPIQTKFNAMSGANDFVKIVDDIMGDYDIEYKNIFILPTMYNKQRRDDKETLVEIKTDFIDFVESCEFAGRSRVTLLETVPERSVFSNSQSVGYFLQDYVECFDKGKRDILLLLENIAKKIRKRCK